MRVVSLLPSATEILFAAGAGDLLVGRSHECDFPAGLGAVPALTSQRTQARDSAEIDREVREALGGRGGAPSLYRLDTERLRALRPDVILTQDLCDVCSIDLATVRGVARSMRPSPQVISLNPMSLEEVFADVRRVGRAVDRRERAEASAAALERRVTDAVALVPGDAEPVEVAFFEWLAPLFVGGHWTPELIALAGGRHSLNPPGAKSRVVAPSALVASEPEAVIIAPCGFDLPTIRRELHHVVDAAWWPELPAVRRGRVALVDGSAMFNRPGPRLVDALEWLVAWLHGPPARPPEGFPSCALPDQADGVDGSAPR